MSYIFVFFVALGVFRISVFCVNVPPREDYAEKLFVSLFNNYDIPNVASPFSTPSPTENYQGRLLGGLFTNEIPNEARNDTPSTPPPSTTSKPAVSKPATEVVYIPVYQEPIYDPNYPIIPPYPVFYDAPIDSRYQLDNFAPYYPVVNKFPSAYESEVQSFPFLNQDPISTGFDRMILQPISQNVMPAIMKPDPINVGSDRIILQPMYQYSMPTNMNPSSINNVPDKTNMQPVYPTVIPSKVNPDAIDTAAKKIILKPITGNENLSSLGQLTDSGRDELNTQIMKLIENYLVKTQQETETKIKPLTEKYIDETSENSDEYKVIEPSTPSVSQFVPSLGTYSTFSISEKQTNEVNQSNAINKLNSSHLVDKIKEDSDSDRALPAMASETTQTAIEVNQSSAGTAENGTDDSSKLDSNTTEGGETDISSTISSKDLINRLKNNQTSANDSKLNDRFITESTTLAPTPHTFTDSKGNKCTAKLVTYNDKEYSLYTCEEKSFDGRNELMKKTVNPDVTYFTEELPSTTEVASPDVRNSQILDESAKYKTESSTLNTVVYSTNFDEIN